MTSIELIRRHAARNKVADDDVAFIQSVAVADERSRCTALVRQYLLYDSQRAVSWHEVQDVLDAISRGDDVREAK